MLADLAEPPVVPIDILLRLKRTQRAKDYAVIGELARRLAPRDDLAPRDELATTTDVDRILVLAPRFGAESSRPAVIAARSADRREVVRALAEEIDGEQLADRQRLARYEEAAAPFLAAVPRLSNDELSLPAGHDRLVRLAEELLPRRVARQPG